MYHTLSQLRDSINQMIERQGENAGCAAFVFTQDDVVEIVGENCDEVYFSKELTQDVLCDVGGGSYIYEEVGGMIDESIRDRKKLAIYSEEIK